ncbi:hypothetical protein [Pseudogracilibacillus auburnensis]|uniref:hypothetical protein n=1 Tax=Pseudogracilibacillus auburnensis TaxID=1494959 RepID=UPI001A963755|nr:hypothetical protein [Pseudogracilibacillus auburnensis]MBO1005774.1 hypothetical protein [Pseudogracilibacillus auburnensis]
MEHRKYLLYSRTTKSGGAVIKSSGAGGGIHKSTSAGGGTTATSSSGGGVAKSTQSGGGSAQTSAAGGNHSHTMFLAGGFQDEPPTLSHYRYYAKVGGMDTAVSIAAAGGPTLETYGASGNHSHGVAIPAHSHDFDIPNHNHSVTIAPHTHDVELESHFHEINIPAHAHEIQHGIYELDVMPDRVQIKVDGNVVPHTAISGDRIDLTPYMAKDSTGKITRGRHEVEILPNERARIEADLILRVFIQSQLGGTH